MGADRCLDSQRVNARQIILEETGGLGVDVVLDMAGTPEAIADGFAVVRKGGEFVAFGIPSRPFEFDYANALVFKGVTVYGINGRKLFETWYQMGRLLASGRLDISPVITHRLLWREFREGFRLMTSRPKTCGKVVLFVAGNDCLIGGRS